LIIVMTEELARLIEEARRRPPMSSDQREEQLRNFAAGNIGLENPKVTRAVIDEAVRRGYR
jgi:hypothetical protein